MITLVGYRFSFIIGSLIFFLFFYSMPSQCKGHSLPEDRPRFLSKAEKGIFWGWVLD